MSLPHTTLCTKIPILYLSIPVNDDDERINNSTVHEMDHPGYLVKIFHKWRHSITFSLLPWAQDSTLPCSLTHMASSQRSPGLAGTSGWVRSFLGTRHMCFSAGLARKLKAEPTVKKGPPNPVLSLCLSPFFFFFCLPRKPCCMEPI